MSYQNINVGSIPNDGTGDTIRNAFIKVNSNFSSSLTGSSVMVGYIPLWLSASVLASSAIYQSGSNVGINTTAFNTIAPETLTVITNNINAIGAYGFNNNYIQLNITNSHQGATSSADLVATNNVGNEYAGYIDMGINGSNYTSSLGAKNYIGASSDAYLYCTGSNLYIGNITPSASVYFFAGGYLNTSSVKLDSNGNITSSGQVITSFIQVPYSSSAKSLTVNPLTGSTYFYTSASVNLQYTYNGTRWTSQSLA